MSPPTPTQRVFERCGAGGEVTGATAGGTGETDAEGVEVAGLGRGGGNASDDSALDGTSRETGGSGDGVAVGRDGASGRGCVADETAAAAVAIDLAAVDEDFLGTGGDTVVAGAWAVPQ